jgi:hypothetical protein
MTYDLPSDVTVLSYTTWVRLVWFVVVYYQLEVIIQLKTNPCDNIHPQFTLNEPLWLHIQYVAKSIATCKKNPYIINQNHIFSKNYCEVISG